MTRRGLSPSSPSSEADLSSHLARPKVRAVCFAVVVRGASYRIGDAATEFGELGDSHS